MPDDAGRLNGSPERLSIEGRASWIAAAQTLAILSVAYGSTLLIVVGLAAMENSLGVSRSILALAGALSWVGTGLGGIVMGRAAERVGTRAIVCFGAVMIAVGLALTATGWVWAICVAHGVFIGFFGMGAIFPPLVVYVSRWFDRRRGTAVALISSGQYVAGVLWPSVIAGTITGPGWRVAFLGAAAVVLLGVLPLALFLRPAPEVAAIEPAFRETRDGAVLGMHPNVVQTILCAASVCCCVPMSIPQTHLVALCGDIGIGAEAGAAMLSILLGFAFVSRQLWGLFADRFGGLATVLAGSAAQALSICGFVLTQNESGLFVVAAIYGLGFAGIIPAYVVAIRDLFPSAEASWRVPLVLFTAMSGMAFGSWLAGRLYDHFGYYGPAFAIGVAFNLANLALIGFLRARERGRRLGRRSNAFA